MSLFFYTSMDTTLKTDFLCCSQGAALAYYEIPAVLFYEL
jgi:hypothetical protein